MHKRAMCGRRRRVHKRAMCRKRRRVHKRAMCRRRKSPWGAGLVVLPHLRDLEALETRRELLVGARRPGRRGSHALLPGTEQTLGEEP